LLPNEGTAKDRNRTYVQIAARVCCLKLTYKKINSLYTTYPGVEATSPDVYLIVWGIECFFKVYYLKWVRIMISSEYIRARNRYICIVSVLEMKDTWINRFLQ
jgi:hypothetical protein